MSNVRDIFSAPSARRRRALVADLNAIRQERRVRAELYPKPRNVSDTVPVAWRDMAPSLWAEFQIGEYEPDLGMDAETPAVLPAAAGNAPDTSSCVGARPVRRPPGGLANPPSGAA